MKKFLALFFVNLFFSSHSLAAYVLEELPQSFESQSPSLSVRSLGGTCLTQLGVQDGVPCAASLLALVKRPRFVATGLVGNGYEAAKTTNDVLYKPMSKSELEGLFEKKNQLAADGSFRLTFLAPSFAAEFAPYQASLRGVIRNASYPIIGVHAVNEKRLLLSWGHEFGNNILVGTHMRFFQRRLVHEEIQMFQAVTSSGTLIKPQEQNGMAFDPSVTWWFDNPWQLRTTLAVENLGWVDRKVSLLPSGPQVLMGLGAAMPIGLGLLEVGVDGRPNGNQNPNSLPLSFGSNYRIGGLQILAGINQEMVSTGLRFSLRSIDLGVGYSSTRWPSGAADNYQQSLLTQFAVGF